MNVRAKRASQSPRCVVSALYRSFDCGLRVDLRLPRKSRGDGRQDSNYASRKFVRARGRHGYPRVYAQLVSRLGLPLRRHHCISSHFHFHCEEEGKGCDHERQCGS